MSVSEEAGGSFSFIVDGEIVATRVPYLMSSIKGLTRISQSPYSFYHHIKVIIAIRYYGRFFNSFARHACCDLGKSLRVGQA